MHQKPDKLYFFSPDLKVSNVDPTKVIYIRGPTFWWEEGITGTQFLSDRLETLENISNSDFDFRVSRYEETYLVSRKKMNLETRLRKRHKIMEKMERIFQECGILTIDVKKRDFVRISENERRLAKMGYMCGL